MPNVLTYTETQAAEQLEARQLKAEVKKENGKDDDTKGRSPSRTRSPETQVEVGSTVTITVNDGPETGKIPGGLIGKEQGRRRRTLNDAGFTNVDLKEAEQEDPDKEADEVISVTPKEGATAAKEAKVTVTYATGKSPVPNFIGSSEQRAPRRCGGGRFRPVQFIEEETNEHRPALCSGRTRTPARWSTGPPTSGWSSRRRRRADHPADVLRPRRRPRRARHPRARALVRASGLAAAANYSNM